MFLASSNITHHFSTLSPQPITTNQQCQGIRADLASCLLESDCVQKDGRSGQECLRDHMDELDMECKNIYKSYVHCKRGMVSGAYADCTIETRDTDRDTI